MGETSIGDQGINASSAMVGSPDAGRTITYYHPDAAVLAETVFDGQFIVLREKKPQRAKKPNRPRPYVPSKQLERWER